MNALLRPPCPYCCKPVSLFSKEWQGQRGSPLRTCPHCGKAVDVLFSGSSYLTGFAPLMALAVASFAFGPPQLGVPLLLVAFGAPLLISVRLGPARA